jgi:uncharacterized C2H2 Zn-finger protein
VESMPKIVRGFRWVNLDGKIALEYKGELIDDIERIKQIVLKCPRCGSQATAYYIHRDQYYYVWHYARGQGKHAWNLGPRNPVTDKIVECLRKPGEKRSPITLSDVEKNALVKVFVKKKGYTKEESELARDVLRRLLQ